MFGDRSLKTYLSSRLPALSTASTILTDKEISDRFKELAKAVIKSSQAYFEVMESQYLNFKGLLNNIVSLGTPVCSCFSI